MIFDINKGDFVLLKESKNAFSCGTTFYEVVQGTDCIGFIIVEPVDNSGFSFAVEAECAVKVPTELITRLSKNILFPTNSNNTPVVQHYCQCNKDDLINNGCTCGGI